MALSCAAQSAVALVRSAGVVPPSAIAGTAASARNGMTTSFRMGCPPRFVVRSFIRLEARSCRNLCCAPFCVGADDLLRDERAHPLTVDDRLRHPEGDESGPAVDRHPLLLVPVVADAVDDLLELALVRIGRRLTTVADSVGLAT